jgi:hypothetical protein
MCEMTVAVPRRRPGGPELIGAVDTAEPAPDPLAAHMGATIGGRENRTGLSGAPTAAWRLSAEATESAVGSLLCLRSRARCCNGRWRGSSFEAGVPSVRASFALLRRTTLPARPVAGMPRDRGRQSSCRKTMTAVPAVAGSFGRPGPGPVPPLSTPPPRGCLPGGSAPVGPGYQAPVQPVRTSSVRAARRGFPGRVVGAEPDHGHIHLAYLACPPVRGKGTVPR